MDYDNINKEDLDYLADMISINIIKYLEGLEWFKPTDLEAEEEILAEIARLMTLLSLYESKNQFEKCAIIKNKINKLQNKLRNL